MRLRVVTPILDPIQLLGANDLKMTHSDSEICTGTQDSMSLYPLNNLAAAFTFAPVVLLAICSEIILQVRRLLPLKSSPDRDWPWAIIPRLGPKFVTGCLRLVYPI
jgi:hypothetical protein